MNDPVTAQPVAFAYALVPDPKRRGRYFAVCLKDVICGGYEHLHPSGKSDIAAWGLQRMQRDMDRRHVRGEWGTPGAEAEVVP